MGNKPAYKVGQFVFLKNNNLKTVQGSRQLITLICRDLYQVLTIEKGGFAYRIRNTRNRAERTVVHTELRNVNLQDMLFMEIDPHKFIQTTGKIIRHNSFKRGNSTALKLLDMSQGDLEAPDNPQVQTTHVNSTKDQEEPDEESFLLSGLDTENVEHENNQELGNMFTSKQETFPDAMRSNITQYNLRNHPKRNVKLNSLKIDNKLNLKSILKSGYVKHYPTIDDLLLLDSRQVIAIKKAIKLHKLENKETFAIKNPNLEEILYFKFKNGISTLLSNYERWLPNNSGGKKVTFNLDEKHKSHIKIKSVILSIEKIEQATFYCVSLKELQLCEDYF